MPHELPPTAGHRWAAYERFFDRYLLGVDNGFGAPEIVEMPANSLSLVFRRT